MNLKDVVGAQQKILEMVAEIHQRVCGPTGRDLVTRKALDAAINNSPRDDIEEIMREFYQYLRSGRTRREEEKP